MRKRWLIPAAGVLVAAAGLVFGKTGAPENGFTLLQYHNADAKFLGDEIITSVDEGIRILNLDGVVVKDLAGQIGKASWIYAADDILTSSGRKVIAYSNHENETRIMELSETDEVLFDEVALTTDTRAIDPILIEVKDGYLLTNTEIEGTVNNPDPAKENGTYSVKLYQSKDLKAWDYVTTVISQKHNTEDGDLRYIDGVLYYFFEQEDYDKGPSAIRVMRSEDEGKTWDEPITLLANDSDHEMASCEWNGAYWRLYYSSDADHPGQSYQGGRVFYIDFTKDFEVIDRAHHSDMPDNEAVRLYETKNINGQICFLFARNFLTDCDLLFRTITIEK